MQINRINQQTTFGYNRALNKELINRLNDDTEHNKIYINNVRRLNNLCNSAEHNLRTSVAKNSADQNILFDIFVALKSTLAKTVEEHFPELNFAKREAKNYYKEDNAIMIKNNYNIFDKTWQYSIASNLDEISTHNALAKCEKNNIDEPKEIEMAKRARRARIKRIKTFDTKDVVNKEEALEIPSVIEKYTPTYSSPKGFKSMGGMKELKEDLYDKIIYPATHPEEAELDLIEYGKRPPRGILFYGPPGCGKTMTAEAVSTEANLPMFKLKISRAGSQYINQTSKNYQEAFDFVEDYARKLSTPCIMLIDEVDGITKGRENKSSGEDLKQMSTLLNLIEGARDRNIIIIGTTNKYDIVDEAIRRRFDDQIYVGMPDEITRTEILKDTLSKWTKGQSLANNDSDITEIAKSTIGFPSSAIVILADKASNKARKDGRREIKKEDFLEEIKLNENLKIREDKYKNNVQRKPVGYSQNA